MVFTTEQLSILNSCTSKNLFINAGPGTGKSTILAEICNRLLKKDKDCKVILITFTNAAAKAIVEKCNSLDSSRITGGTFHSIAYRSLKRRGFNYSICDENKKQLIIKSLFNCRKDKQKFEEIYEQISTAKTSFPYKESPIMERYCQELKKYQLLDFDDIITTYIDKPESFTNTHILVDEIQDTNASQVAMLASLVKDNTDSLIIGVGDIDQCLYEFRNSRPENVYDFIKTYSCTVFNMGTNFRSKNNIVLASSRVIKNNKNRLNKEIRSYTSENGQIAHYQCSNPFEEIDYAVSKCLQNSGKEIAILYRNRTFKYQLEFSLRKNGIKYKVNDLLDITDRSAVRVVIACLKIAAGCYDLFDLEHATKALKGIGTKTLASLKEECVTSSLTSVLAKWSLTKKTKTKLVSITNLQESFKETQGLSLDNLVLRLEKEFISSFDYQSQMRQLLIDITRPYKVTAQDISDLSNDLGLSSTEDTFDEDKDALVTLSTVHAFKGLEKDIVILPWCHVYDDTNNPEKEYDLEAERRLFYVGITRAKSKVYLSYSNNKPLFINEMKI